LAADAGTAELAVANTTARMALPSTFQAIPYRLRQVVPGRDRIGSVIVVSPTYLQ
jgi:hypothetical protein